MFMIKTYTLFTHYSFRLCWTEERRTVSCSNSSILLQQANINLRTVLLGRMSAQGNNFASIRECRNACLTRDICSLPAVTGPWGAYFPRWYYDSKTGRCREFVYGDCGGNENNFESRSECIQRCGGAGVY